MAYEFLLTSLPALSYDSGGAATITPARLVSMYEEEGGAAARLAREILMVFDVRSLELIEMGIDPFDMANFTERELREREGLPEWLMKALDSDGAKYGYPFDRVWEAYYRRLAEVASESGSGFLKRWVSWDIGLRNAVAELRAARAGIAGAALMIEGLSTEYRSIYRPVLDSIVSYMDGGFDAWREMDRSLAQLRLAKASELAPGYVFNLDEVLGYAMQYSILRNVSYLHS